MEQFIYKTGSSNVIMSDFPDLDVIRVGDVYYMASTTMHFFPGGVILRSYNLLDWEICSFIFDNLDDTKGQKLEDDKGIYGKGMWAASLRFHNGKFYAAFVANDTHKSYLYTSDSIEGPWKKSVIEGFYHDMSLLFDDDGKIYIASGNTDIRIVQMKEDLSGPLEGGLNKVVVQDDRQKVDLGYEGSHFYKINGKYYLFFIHKPRNRMRTEACYVSDSISGPYKGGDVLCSDLGGWNSGVAQGGIVQAPDGKWYGMLFQDHGALGRIPVLVPVRFKNDFPVFGDEGKVPAQITVMDSRPGYKYKELYGCTFCNNKGEMEKFWQWNHQCNKNLVELSKNTFRIKTDKTVKNPVQACNTLTQRTFGEKCRGEVTVDFSNIRDGDTAGFCALEGEYGFIGIRKENGIYYLVTCEHKIPYSPWSMGVFDGDEPSVIEKIPFEALEKKIRLCMDFNLHYPVQSVNFSWYDINQNKFVNLGKEVVLRYTLDQFVGVRYALFMYSTEFAGGEAVFSDFVID